MPTVFYVGAYRFFFYSEEGGEPAHIHIEDGDKAAKFWLHDAGLARSRNMRGHELAALGRLVAARKDELTEAWNEHFSRVAK